MARVLVLEDEKLVARDIQSTLAGAGYETSVAASGEEAIEIARQDQPDLALVDIHLAGKLDGIETARALRQELELPVVYLTAHSDAETLDRAKATEPFGYLVKPFDETTLRTTVQMAVHKSEIERRKRLEQKRLTSVLDQSTVGLITTDRSGRVNMMNARAQSLTGWSSADALGKDLTRVLSLCNSGKVSITGDLLSSALGDHREDEPKGLLRLVSKSGTETEVEQRVSLIGNENERTAAVSLVFWPAGISSRDSDRSEKSEEADTDPLTGLLTRASATAVIEGLRQRQPHLFTALFVLDRYYVLVKKYGTRTADEVLASYCTYLAQQIQEKLHCKRLFRWTGPSFLTIFGPLDCLRSARTEIGHMKLAREFELSSRMALLSLSASAEIFSLDDHPSGTLISEIDSFVAMQMKQQQY